MQIEPKLTGPDGAAWDLDVQTLQVEGQLIDQGVACAYLVRSNNKWRGCLNHLLILTTNANEDYNYRITAKAIADFDESQPQVKITLNHLIVDFEILALYPSVEEAITDVERRAIAGVIDIFSEDAPPAYPWQFIFPEM